RLCQEESMVARVVQKKVELVEQKGSLLRDTLLFFAGAEGFHTLTHAWLGVSGFLPMSVSLFPSVEITQGEMPRL
ncbi:MAG TPA: hypothetical protein VMR02_06115, partial [Terracidiphilus sp.]|nr:hypothetical protein [Terracidiphilus sp.]